MQFNNLRTNKKILIIGDVILDKYVYGNINRISPEAPVPIINVEKEENKLGGAANVHNNLISLGVNSDIISVVGNDSAGLFLSSNIPNFQFYIDKDKKTPVKTRIISQGQQLMRIDDESTETISEKIQKKIIKFIKANIKNYSMLVISDYGKGTLSKVNGFMKDITTYAKNQNIPILVDPHNGIISGRYQKNIYDVYDYGWFDYIKLNKKQAEALTGWSLDSLDKTKKCLLHMIKEFSAKGIVLTLSDDGLLVKQQDEFGQQPHPIKHYVGKVTEISDVTGAGDTTMAVLAWALNLGYNLYDAAELANAAGNIKVTHHGTYPVTVSDLKNYFNSSKKIVESVAQISRNNKKVVFTNGCFDILHPGHIAMLKYAKSQGDILVVGLNSDSSVKMNKGDSRPYIRQDGRAKMLEALDCVDYVVLFYENTPLELINELKPDVHVKGGDHSSETDGVPITLFFDRIKEYSSTKLIERDYNPLP